MADQDRFEDRLAKALAGYADEAPVRRGLDMLAESVTARPQRRGLFARLAGAGSATAPLVGATRSAMLVVVWLLLLALLIASIVAGAVVVGGWLRSNDFSVVPTASPSPMPTAAFVSPRPATPTPPPVALPTSPVPTMSVAPSAIPSVPSDELLAAGSLSVCADLSQQSLSFIDANGNPAGLDIDMASAIAGRLGLRLEVVDTSFFARNVFEGDQVSRAVTGGTCDIVVAGDPYLPRPIGRSYANVIPFLDRGAAVLESIYVPLDHVALADTVDAELLSVVGDGTYEQILNSWNQSGYYRAWPVDQMTVHYGLPTQLLIVANGAGGGVVTSDPPGIACSIPLAHSSAGCTATYNAGTHVTLSAAPDSSSVFSGWSGGGCKGTGDCVVTLDSNAAVMVTFTALPEKTP